ncbi:MAG: hypothetical protein JSS63_04425 [Bacteroidetes bacterium]|nr:hypothetical protein [Bacteroidota bacterium]
MSKKEKTFDTMKWVRSVRDEMFDKYYKGDLTEYSKAMSTPAKSSIDKLFPRDPIPQSRIKRKSSDKRVKSFDAVKWVREIRDKMYEENKHLTTEEYFKKISNRVQDEFVVKEKKIQYKKNKR